MKEKGNCLCNFSVHLKLFQNNTFIEHNLHTDYQETVSSWRPNKVPSQLAESTASAQTRGISEPPRTSQPLWSTYYPPAGLVPSTVQIQDPDSQRRILAFPLTSCANCLRGWACAMGQRKKAFNSGAGRLKALGKEQFVSVSPSCVTKQLGGSEATFIPSLLPVLEAASPRSGCHLVGFW